MREISLGPVGDIPLGEARAYAVGGRQVAVFRLRDGTLKALDGICPHRGGPLADGLTDCRIVVCPLHGFTYDLASGEEVANGGAPVTAYPVRVDDTGTVRLRMGGAEADQPQCNGVPAA
jgi:nitrite reductase (NADH) small subunit